MNAPKNGLVVEYLKTEGYLSRAGMRNGLKQWQDLENRPNLGTYLIELNLLQIDHYVQLLSRLDSRVRPCQQCKAPRYVPTRTKGASPCRRCKNPETPHSLSGEFGRALLFEHYELKRMLGRGAMGVVYEAEYKPAGRIDALKIMLPRFNNERRTKRFDRESAILAKLRHRNIIGVHRAGSCAGLRFLALNFVDGGDLKEYLQNQLSLEQIYDILVQLSSGLAAAHEAEIIHRDLKPANIFINTEGTPLIGDFGLAIDLLESQRLTRTGASVGTPYYMSPEQLSGDRELIGPAADLYAMGVILYEMVTGQRPYQAKSMPELRDMIFRRERLPMSDFRPDVPHALENICEHLLEPDLEYRLDDARELEKALKWIAHPEGETPFLIDRPVRNPNKPIFIGLLVTAMIVLIVGGLTLALWDFGPSTPTASHRAKMKRSLERARERTRELVQRIPSNPAKAFSELEGLDSKLVKLGQAYPALFKDFKGKHIKHDMIRARAYATWLEGGKSSRKQALEILKEVDGPEVALDRATFFLHTGQFQESLAGIEKLRGVKLPRPLEERYLRLQGSLYFMRGQFSECLRHYELAAHRKSLRSPWLERFIEAITIEGQSKILAPLLARAQEDGFGGIEASILEATSSSRRKPILAWTKLNEIQSRTLDNATLFQSRGVFLEQYGWPELAREDFKQALALETPLLERCQSLLELADVELSLGSWDRARGHYQEALSFTKRWIPPVTPHSFEESFERRLRIDNLRAHALLGLSRLARLESKTDAANQLLDQALSAGPIHSPVLLALAKNAHQRGDPKSKDYLARAIQCSGARPSARLFQGFLALQNKDSGAAEKAFTAAFAIAKKGTARADALLGLAHASKQAKRNDEAKLLQVRALANDQQDPIYRRNARSFVALKDLPVLSRSKEKALERQVRYQLTQRTFPAALHLLRAKVFLSQGRLGRAQKALDKSREMNDRAAELHLTAGRLEMRKERPTQALEDFKKAVSLGQSTASPHFFQALILQSLGRHKEALPAITQAIELEPWHQTLYQTRRDILRKLDRLDEANEDRLRSESFNQPVGRDYENKLRKAFQQGDNDDLWRLAWNRPGRAASLYDYGRSMGLGGGSPQSFAVSILALTYAVRQRPHLESPMCELLNQLVAFGNRDFMPTVITAAKKHPRFHVDSKFTQGLLEFYEYLITEKKRGSMVRGLIHFEQTLDLEPKHLPALAYHALLRGVLGYESNAKTTLIEIGRKDKKFLGPHFFLAVIEARQNETAACFQELAKSDAVQRVSVIQEFTTLFPESLRRSPNFRAAVGIR